jgi:hypothetical protein
MGIELTPQAMSAAICLVAVVGLVVANWDRISAAAARLKPVPPDLPPASNVEERPETRVLELLDQLVQDNGRLQLRCDPELKAIYGKVIDRFSKPQTGEQPEASA